MLHLRLYYDFASPFCYVACEIARGLRRTYDLDIDWAPFEVIDYLPERGAMPQNPAFVRRGEAERAYKLAAEYGLELHLRDRLLNSNLALCSVEYAKDSTAASQDTAEIDSAVAELFAAYYRDQSDISDMAVVVAACGRAGLHAAVESALISGSYKHQVAESRRAAQENGVVAVPTWIVNGFGIVGVPSKSEIERLITTASASKTSTASS